MKKTVVYIFMFVIAGHVFCSGVLNHKELSQATENTAQVKGNYSEEGVRDIRALDHGKRYGFINGQLVISYGEEIGEEWRPVPIEGQLDLDHIDAVQVFSDPHITAVAYDGDTSKDKVWVKVTTDDGRTWSKAALLDNRKVESHSYDQSGEKFIGFTSDTEGWIVTTGEVGMGAQNNFIYKTKDGGNSWTMVGSTNDVCSRVISEVLFWDQDTGFMSFRYEDSQKPMVFITKDGGCTWKTSHLVIPPQYESGIGPPSPKFSADKKTIRYFLRDDFDEKVLEYKTEDGGLSWTLIKEPEI